MRRAASAVLLAVLSTVGAFAQEKKGDKPPTDLFPLAKGTKWEYVLKGYEEVEWVVEVTDVTEPKKGERAVATFTSKVGKQVLTAKHSADEKGVYEHTRGGWELDTPLFLLKHPVQTRAKWTETYKYRGDDATSDYEVKAAEELKLPAGKYTAYPVVQTIKTRLGKSTVTNWYADGVGMVKQEIRAFGKPDVVELKSFTPAKAK
jgi:hypothetical protein